MNDIGSLPGSKNSMYLGGSQTGKYRQVSIGKAGREDFTTVNVKDKGDYSYDLDKLPSMKQALISSHKRGT
jgi:hypothetical protein